MKKLTKIIIAIIGVLTLHACSDVLDITPKDKISEDNVWSDENLIRSYMSANYASAFPQGLYRNTQIGHATDELHSIKGSVFYYLITRGELTPDNVTTLNEYMNNWQPAYTTIRDVNIFLDKIVDSTIDETIKEEMTAEMKFVRAFLYSQLIWRYGGVPIIEGLFKLEDDYTAQRASYDDCVDFIVHELDEAIAVLPAQQSGTLGLASADAARALKSRVLLYAASAINNPNADMNKWQAASDAAEELITGGNYSLHGDYADLFLSQNDEIIFARYFTQANTYDMTLQVGRNGDNGWGSDSPTQNLVNGYEMNNGEFPYLSDGSVNVASGFDPNDPYANRDPRLYATILHDGAIWMGRETQTYMGGMDSRDGPIAAWNGSMSGYYTHKFVPEDIPPTGSTVNPTSPWIMFRYGETLLNYAEAQFMLGNEAIARDYINLVRDRTGINMPPIIDAGAALESRIQHERRIELVFEGHRYFDVRRWEIAEDTEAQNIMGVTIEMQNDGSKDYGTQTLLERTWDQRLNLLPIPRAEIDRSLGSLVQNPGYQ